MSFFIPITPMFDVSDKLVEDFIQLYKEQTGELLSFQKAQQSANLAVEIYSILLGLSDS